MTSTRRQISSPPSVWERVVCAVDGSPSSLQAARAAARLMPATANLTLCAIVSADDRQLIPARTRDAEEALRRVQTEIQSLHTAEPLLRQGPAIHRLLDEIQAERATLVALGAPEPTDRGACELPCARRPLRP